MQSSNYFREVDGLEYEFMAVNTPKLKLLLVLEQSLKLRLGGSGVASMFTPLQVPCAQHITLPVCTYEKLGHT